MLFRFSNRLVGLTKTQSMTSSGNGTGSCKKGKDITLLFKKRLRNFEICSVEKICK